jgi:beta-N-acetylhexosaminidase
MCDSHTRLPRVEAAWPELRQTDFAPFRCLAGLPLGMTAHVVYSAIDPDQPATLSPTIISRVIREEIGFDGLLMTDDLSMGALSGPLTARARGALAAGCDIVLHCSGNRHEMADLAAAVPVLSGRSLERAQAALSLLDARRPGVSAPSGSRLDALLSRVA